MGRSCKDETGNKYGKWTVLRKAEERNSCNQVCWVCRCQCGNEKIVSGKVLRRGKSTSCGCWKTIIYPGDKFGLLTALENTGKKDDRNHYIWKCQCQCGNITYVRDGHLISGNTKSCGCLANNKRHQLLGQKFGLLTVIEDAGNDSYGNSIWKCKCDCGNIGIYKGSNLVSGNTISCGCSKMSKGELAIKFILDNNNIIYQQEYSPKELNGKRFDFAIFDSEYNLIRLIEFDGIQHYEEWKWKDTKDTLEARQQRDKEKNQWALQHNIPLVRIPYWELENINKDIIFKDNFII